MATYYGKKQHSTMAECGLWNQIACVQTQLHSFPANWPWADDKSVYQYP